jgi:hypothetical protein
MVTSTLQSPPQKSSDYNDLKGCDVVMVQTPKEMNTCTNNQTSIKVRRFIRQEIDIAYSYYISIYTVHTEYSVMCCVQPVHPYSDQYAFLRSPPQLAVRGKCPA